MKAWLMDCYRKQSKIAIWFKGTSDWKEERDFSTSIYAKDTSFSRDILTRLGLVWSCSTKKDFTGKSLRVLQIETSDPQRVSRMIESEGRHRLELYNADITPEQMFIYQNKITLFQEPPVLKECFIVVYSTKDPQDPLSRIRAIEFDTEKLEGEEQDILQAFEQIFAALDPDVIRMPYAFSRLPLLDRRLKAFGIDCKFHRWDPEPIDFKGSRSLYSYGQVRYHEFAIRLHGRFLVDQNTMVASSCSTSAIVELCQISSCLFQQAASRSFGALFQSSLVKTMLEQDLLVPYKEKPLEEPLSMLEMLKADRAGLTLDPKVGFHRDVAEIDFTSMYPWLIYNKNISAETILSRKEPIEKAPGIAVSVSFASKGLVPQAIKPFLDRRMHYKALSTPEAKEMASGLKWVLVTSYGYLRFREFKLGLSSAHMAICAHARQTLLLATRTAERRGFQVVHGIVDSLYLKKKGMNKEQVIELCQEIEQKTGIPLSFEGIFDWIVFLPSVADSRVPVPCRYYGSLGDKLKVRGLETRTRSAPKIVKEFQDHILDSIKGCKTRKEIERKIPEIKQSYFEHCKSIPNLSAQSLEIVLRLGKEQYKSNIPQKKIAQSLKAVPGMMVGFVMTRSGPVLTSEYKGKPDVEYYQDLLWRAMKSVMSPFGLSSQSVLTERQTILEEYSSSLKTLYIPAKIPALRKGASEKLLRQRLERTGWIVWRGSLVGAEKDLEAYPNIKRKYSVLTKLLKAKGYDPIALEYLSKVHHGIPDLLCFKDGKFLFVECKLEHEQLSRAQKICAGKLSQLGFRVEVHRLVSDSSRFRMFQTREGKKILVEEQTRIKY